MMRASQASVLQSFKTPTIRVVVGTGKDTETYFLNKDLVRRLTKPLSSMLEHGWKETQKRVVRLPADEPQCFESLLRFTIWNDVGFGSADVQRGKVWLPIRAWIMGEKYGALAFRDSCMRFIYTKARELDIVNIEYVFYHTVQEQHLNRWTVHYICQHYGRPARLYPATGSTVAEWLHLFNNWEHLGICFMRFSLYAGNDTPRPALLQPCSHYLFDNQTKRDWSLGAEEDPVWDKVEEQKQEMLAAMEDDEFEEI